MSKLEELLNSYCSFLQTLQHGSIDQLDTYLAENVFFKDPFHETIGIKKFKFIISSMFLNFKDINKKKFKSLTTMAIGYSLDGGDLKSRKIFKTLKK